VKGFEDEDFRILTDSPDAPFKRVRKFRCGKDMYERACIIAGYSDAVELSPFCPQGHIYGLDADGKVVLLLGPR
jgi:hypothetical protein